MKPESDSNNPERNRTAMTDSEEWWDGMSPEQRNEVWITHHEQQKALAAVTGSRSESPDTDSMEEADYHQYGEDDYVPISCYHRMKALAREMEASAKSGAKLLGHAWEEMKEARSLAVEDSLFRSLWVSCRYKNATLHIGDDISNLNQMVKRGWRVQKIESVRANGANGSFRDYFQATMINNSILGFFAPKNSHKIIGETPAFISGCIHSNLVSVLRKGWTPFPMEIDERMNDAATEILESHERDMAHREIGQLQLARMSGENAALRSAAADVLKRARNGRYTAAELMDVAKSFDALESLLANTCDLPPA